jgi:GntR family transcriptional regulator
MTRTPSYVLVYNAIKHDIREQNYLPGELLPTESELEKKFSVSRTTVRHAIEILRTEGYVKVEQGRGTAVQNPFTTQKLNCVTSITETLTAKGYTVTTRGMHIERVQAPDYAAEALGIKDDSPVFRVQRIQCADKVPIALMTNYLKTGVVPDIDKYAGAFTSLYAFLEEHYGVILKDAVETISAVSATFIESQVLQVPVGAPLLISKRVSSTVQGPVEYGVTKLVAEKYEYSVYLSGRMPPSK